MFASVVTRSMTYHRAQTQHRRPSHEASRSPVRALSGRRLALGGCGTIEKDRKVKAMDAALTTYGEAIRWGYFDTAYGYVHPDKRTAAPSTWKTSGSPSYEVLQPPLMKGEKDWSRSSASSTSTRTRSACVRSPTASSGATTRKPTPGGFSQGYRSSVTGNANAGTPTAKR